MYTREDVIHYIENENVRFIRLAFFDLFGKQKNISIQPSEINKAFEKGILIDGSAIFGGDEYFGLYLVPDPKTMTVIPWRSYDGSVIVMYCDLYTSEHKPYVLDTRALLRNVLKEANDLGIDVLFASQFEFYLFHKDENGLKTDEPLDRAGYMDIAPEDKGENIRRQICYYLSEMGLEPQSSHHEAGPGQNEVDFHASNPLVAADEAAFFKWIVRTTAESNGLFADFSPKPLDSAPGNAMIIRIHVADKCNAFTAGVLKHLKEMTLFFNPGKESYRRLGTFNSPSSVGCSYNDPKQAIRLYRNSEDLLELRCPDNLANPYIVYALILSAGREGIRENLSLSDERSLLPLSLDEARSIAKDSAFISCVLPEEILAAYLG